MCTYPNVGFLQLFILLTCVKSCQLSRPMGVSIERSALYDFKDGFFYCFTNSLKIPKSFVNDNYCDCEDGSDEPGTSACNTGKFFCRNEGFLNKYINSSNVNDGICDCCDGTDEYKQIIDCEDNCREQGSVFREKMKQKIQINELGLKTKTLYIQQAQQGKHERHEKLSTIAKERDTANEEKNRLEQIKKDIESKEGQLKETYQAELKVIKDRLESEKKMKRTEKLFQKLDGDANGRLSSDEFLTNMPALPQTTPEQDNDRMNVCDTNQDGKLDMQDMLAKFQELQKVEIDVNDFFHNITDALDRCHPESFLDELSEENKPETQTVSPAPPEEDKLFEGYETAEHPLREQLQPPHPEEADLPEPEHPHDGDDGRSHDAGEEDDEDDDDATEEDVGGDDEDDLYPRDRDQEPVPPRHGKNRIRHHDPPATKDADELLPYTDEMRNVLAEAERARKEFQDADNKWKTLDSQYSSLKRVDDLDLGNDMEYAALVNQCYELDDHDYIYRLCAFKNVVQKSKDSSSETIIGNWQSFEPHGEDRYAFMKFGDGQQCWNGPKRSTKVKLLCGSDNKVLSVSEPSRCEYYMEFTTPAKCMPVHQRPDLKEYLDYFRDEL